MAKIKGIKKLNATIKKELEPFDVKVHYEGEFICDLVKKSVSYSFVSDTIEQKWMVEFVKKKFDYTPINHFMLALLHEVGHAKTTSIALYNYSEKARKAIDKKMEKATTKKEQKKVEWEYFMLPEEITATAWAVEYMKNHEKQVKKMWKNIEKEIFNVYEKNLDIDDEM